LANKKNTEIKSQTKKGKTTGRKKSASSRSKKESAETAEKRAQVQEEMQKAHASRRIRDIISGLIYIAIGLFIFASVQFHAAGEFGNQLGLVLKGIFGVIGLLLPWYLMLLGVLFITGKMLHFTQRSLWITVGILLLLCVMNAGRFIVPAQASQLQIDVVQFYTQSISLKSGGVFGMTVGSILVKFIGEAGLYILSAVLLLICLLLLLNTPLSKVIIKRKQQREEDRRVEQLMQESIADRSYQEELEKRKREANLQIRGPEDFLREEDSSAQNPEAMTERYAGQDLDGRYSHSEPASKKSGILHSFFQTAEAAARREKAKHKRKPSNVMDVMQQNPLKERRTQEIPKDVVLAEQAAERQEPKISFGSFDADGIGGNAGGSAETLRRQPEFSSSENAAAETDRFSRRESSGTYGLDPVAPPSAGFGLDGENARSSETDSFGLQPPRQTRSGFGLQKDETFTGRPDTDTLKRASAPDHAAFEGAQQAEQDFGQCETVMPKDGVHQNADGEWVSNNMIEETSRNTMKRVLKSADDLMREEQASREREQNALGRPASRAARGETVMKQPAKTSAAASSNGARAAAAGIAMAGEAAKNIQKKTKFVYRKPSLDLLTPPELPSTEGLNQQLRQKAHILEDTLDSFHVDAHVVQVTQGPAVTRYEIQPGPGVKVSKIVGLSDDIALNLRAKSIRIEAPIPGKAAVGIEVENERIQMVRIREIIGSKEFRQAKSKISFAVGKDIAGNAVVADLKGMPHLLIAGATGSGKSVCINSIITSILYKASPDEVKLVLIDPKVVELGNYNGIPHLLIPVVTDPGKAAAALNWAVSEMTDRYKKFADENVRDLKTFNSKMEAEDRRDEKMPQVVIIIDELADLMMAAPNQVEESICRLAQLARAAGMHLIVATQRPSVDIITGLIKANIPSRIAFAVSSQFDSRTILDMNGAEKLVGKGDMLFNPQGSGKPLRVQGTFISDEEINRVIQFVKDQAPQQEPSYNEAVIQDIEQKSVPGSDDAADELLPDAISCVVNAEKASTSMLQRHFRIGYNRAARIMDEMEERGIVSPQDGSHPRQVLLTQDELEQMNDKGSSS
jgi:DNA segregation ATPase FtsK/SpoIIIE-like protein